MRSLLLRVLFAAESVAAIYGLIETLIRRDAVVFFSLPISDHFLEVTYVFFIAFGILAIIGMNWRWISKMPIVSKLLYSRSAALGDLYDEIAKRRDELIGVLDNDQKSPETLAYLAKTQELYTALQALGIPCPAGVPDTELDRGNKQAFTEWCTFLMKLAAEARVRNLRAARALAK